MSKEHLKTLIKGNDMEGGDIIEFFEKILGEKTLIIDLKFEYQSNPKLKQLVKLFKIPDQYSVALEKDILVQFNEQYFDNLEDNDNELDKDEIKKILIEQEIDKIEVNAEKGTFRIGKHSVSTNFGIVKKYTYDKVQRAIEIEKLAQEQSKEVKGE